MQAAIILVLFSILAFCGGPAGAETRTFVIVNEADAYGVDRCLATGASCGATVARAYCQSQEFADALSFRKVLREEITDVTLAGGSGCHADCDFVAIECGR